jgi:hypothetical protein
MPNCYQCGQYFKSGDFQLRRKVRTGEQLTKQYRSGKVNVLSVRYGKRVVCKKCANEIDRENKRAIFAPYFGLLALLGILFMFYVYSLIVQELKQPPIISEVENGIQ